MKSIKTMTAIIVIFTLNLFAQTGDVTKEPGYVDFGDLTQFEKSTGVTEVTLDEDLLSTLAEISTDEDPNVMEILKGLKLVKANVFEVNESNQAELEARVNSIDSRLINSNWKRIVRTRSNDELANVYIKRNNNKEIVGLAVTTVEKNDEAAFVNIVGKINLASIGRIGKQFNIPHLNDVKHNKEKSDEN